MTSKISGGPAFPRVQYHDHRGDFHPAAPGLTVRQYFAGQAMLGILANPNTEHNPLAHQVASIAHALADAMIAEGEKS